MTRFLVAHYRGDYLVIDTRGRGAPSTGYVICTCPTSPVAQKTAALWEAGTKLANAKGESR